ncbi:MAG: hypothetical protein NZ765_04115 [Anaerolineae bacterium]|nr:hypothetical protein [Anaerolineae bacterium]
MTMPQPEVPTDTPLPVAPIVPNTATWIVESTLASGIASAPTETATATVTPSATPTSTWTRLPTITPTATRTPTSTRPTRLPTSTPRPTATATPQIFFFAGALPFLGGGILCLGGGVFTLSVLSGMIWMGIRRGNVHKMAPARCHPLHARHPVAPSASSQGRRMDASLSHREGSPESGPKIEREDDLDDRSA